MSSSILRSQGMAMALATAMAALSGTLIVFSLCLHKSHPSISSVGKKKETTEKKKKRRKRVHFADDVPISSEDLQRRKKGLAFLSSSPPATGSPPPCLKLKKSNGGMPANRVALYNGILRDRLVHRMVYSL